MTDRQPPNDLDPDALAYWSEYVDAGGTEHAAKAYAAACHVRDTADEQLRTLICGGEVTMVGAQGIMALNKTRTDASTTAEKLRGLLPDKGGAEAGGAHFDD